MLVIKPTDWWKTGGNSCHNKGDDQALWIKGRLSIRDDKDPQIVANLIRPLSDTDPYPGEQTPREGKLYIRLKSQEDAALERIKLILTMFPGQDQLIIYFEDTKKKYGTSCIIHPVLIKELEEMLGKENVVVK